MKGEVVRKLNKDEIAIWEKLSGGVEYEDFVRSAIGDFDCYEVTPALSKNYKAGDDVYEYSAFIRFLFGKTSASRQGVCKIQLFQHNGTRFSAPSNFDFNIRLGGLGSKAMGNIIHASRKTGIKEMQINSVEVGAYIWNVMGGVPNQAWFLKVCKEIDVRLEDGYANRLLKLVRGKNEQADKAAAAIKMLDVIDPQGDPKQLWAVSELDVELAPRPDSPESEFAKSPTKLGKLLMINNPWLGKFDLRDDSPTMQKLTAYEILKGFKHER